MYIWSAKSGITAKLGSDTKSTGHLHEVNDVELTENLVLSTSDDASVLVWRIWLNLQTEIFDIYSIKIS